MECEDHKSAGDQKSQGLAAAEKIVLFVDGAIWLWFTGSKNQLDILIFSPGSDCNLDLLDYISQNQVF